MVINIGQTRSVAFTGNYNIEIYKDKNNKSQERVNKTADDYKNSIMESGGDEVTCEQISSDKSCNRFIVLTNYPQYSKADYELLTGAAKAINNEKLLERTKNNFLTASCDKTSTFTNLNLRSFLS